MTNLAPAAFHPGIYALPQAQARIDAITDRARRQDELLDAALQETFPASDPVSVMCLA